MGTFMTVRHPISRFFSAFFLKFRKISSEGSGELRGFDLLLDSGIEKSELKNYKRYEPESGMIIHPIDLINAIADHMKTFNHHFQPQSYSCRICQFKYRYIIRVETMGNFEAMIL